MSNTTSSRGVLLLAAALLMAGLGSTISTPANAQESRCDGIEDRRSRLRCKWGESDAKTHDDERHGWREEEARIRRDHERACARVGKVARFTGVGRLLKAACVAPRVINDRINR